MDPVQNRLLGLSAVGSDGKHIGRVTHCDPDAFTVEFGLVFKRDVFVPYDQVVRTEGEQVVLREPARFYGEGGDADDAHWNAEVARRTRDLHREISTAHDIGLQDGRKTGAH